MSTQNPTPGPRPGPAGPDPDDLRSAFDELLAGSAPAAGAADGDEQGEPPVTDEQVEALDAAHELLAQALASLDSAR